MTTALVLPAAFPDLHWLGRTCRADRVILDDTLPFSRKSTVHRGRIRTPSGQAWIYLPVHPEDRAKPLHQARIDTVTDWLTPLLRSLEFNYRNSIWFDHYEHELHETLQQCASAEGYLNAILLLNRKMFQWLELSDRTQSWQFRSGLSGGNFSDTSDQTFSNRINVTHNSASESGETENSTKSVICTEYRSRNYQPPVHGSVEILDIDQAILKSPRLQYRQHFGAFEPGCCWLDLLFACGPESWQILDSLLE
jgi:hypothetical protein